MILVNDGGKKYILNLSLSSPLTTKSRALITICIMKTIGSFTFDTQFLIQSLFKLALKHTGFKLKITLKYSTC